MEPWHKGVIYFLVSLVSFPPASFEHFPGRQERLRCLFVWLCVCVFVHSSDSGSYPDKVEIMRTAWTAAGGEKWQRRIFWKYFFLPIKVAQIIWPEWCLFLVLIPAFQHLSIFLGPMWIVSCGVCPMRWRGLFWCDLTAGKPGTPAESDGWAAAHSKGNINWWPWKKGNQQNFQNRMLETACILDLHVHAWMPYISVCAKNSLFQQVMHPLLWCLACGFLVKAVKQRSITSTDAQMCSARRDKQTKYCSFMLAHVEYVEALKKKSHYNIDVE